MKQNISDAEIVATRLGDDGMNYFAVARGGRWWLVQVHSDEFDQYGSDMESRRGHLDRALLRAMQETPGDTRKIPRSEMVRPELMGGSH